MPSDLDRALDFARRVYEGSATENVKEPWGVATFNSDLDQIWDMNHLRVDRPVPGLDAERLIEESRHVQTMRGLDFGSIMVFDESEGRGLAPGFDAAGWRNDIILLMGTRTRVSEGAPAAPVEELDRAAAVAARRVMRLDSEDWGDDEKVTAQMERWDDLICDLAGTRWFAAKVNGRVVSMCEVYSDGSTAQIEDVVTLTPFRRRGLARAVVSCALGEALDEGHDFVFLMANDRSRPKELYRRLGFRPLGRFYHFLKTG